MLMFRGVKVPLIRGLIFGPLFKDLFGNSETENSLPILLLMLSVQKKKEKTKPGSQNSIFLLSLLPPEAILFVVKAFQKLNRARLLKSQAVGTVDCRSRS